MRLCAQPLWHHHGVDGVDDAVRRSDIGRCDRRLAALGIGQHDLVARHAGFQFAACNGFNRRGAFAVGDHLDHIGCLYVTGHDMICQDCGQLVLGFWL